MSGLQPLAQMGLVTQGVALGWDIAAPLALNMAGLSLARSKRRLVQRFTNPVDASKEIVS